MLRKLVLVCLFAALLLVSACSSARKIHINAECGVLMNNVFNKIGTEEDCRVQCRNQCLAYDQRLASSTLNHDATSGCNSCDCLCR